MKKTILTLAIIVIISGINMSACAQTQDNKQASNQQDKSIEVQKFRKEVNEKVKLNETRIAELRTKMSKEKKDAKKKYAKKIDDLEQKNKDLKTKMANYKEDSKENWQSFKKEFNHDMEELGKALKFITVDDVD